MKQSGPPDTFSITNRFQSSKQESILKTTLIEIDVPLKSIKAKVSSSVLYGGKENRKTK